MHSIADTSTAGEGRAQSDLLPTIWPRPRQWTDLVATCGAARAARTMVIYENIAQMSHRDGWMGVSGAVWRQAYVWGVKALQEILAAPGALSVEAAKNAYDGRMEEFGVPFPAKSTYGQWSYALGLPATKATRHPFHLHSADALRWQYLPEWGWGVDSRVSNYLAVGAVRVHDPITRGNRWRAVKGLDRKLAYLDPSDFGTEQEALEFARGIVESQYLSPPGKFGP